MPKMAFLFLRKESKIEINWDMGRKCSENK
jgi:hypothetical protein